MKIRYSESAPLGPSPVSELPGARNIAWTPGRELNLPDDDARRLLRSGGRAFEKVDATAVAGPRTARKPPKAVKAKKSTPPKKATNPKEVNP